jgi:hypothetical protein
VQWRVDWADKYGQFTHSHCSETAADRHIDNLLTDRTPGLSIADIFTDLTE